MTSPSDIRWGKYTDSKGTKFEGPYFHGNWKFELSESPTINECIVYAITATEGGTYDAVNMYDVCVMTVGVVQWCDRFHLVSKMLGYVADKCGVQAVSVPLADAMSASGAIFKRNRNAQWRFFQHGVECSTPSQLRNLYFGGSSGLLGQWTESQKLIARKWAAGMANIWNDEKARVAQLEYTKSRISMFTLEDSRKIMLDSNDSWEGLVGATKAIYISYSANNPTTADGLVKAAVFELEGTPEWSEDWCVGIIKKLALDSSIRIWPGRYDKVSKAVNKIFGTKLPESHNVLATWTPSQPDPLLELEPIDKPVLPDVEPDTEPEPPSFDVNVPGIDQVVDTQPSIDVLEIPEEHEQHDTDPSPAPIVRYRSGWSIIDFIVMFIRKIFETWVHSRNR